MKTFMSIIVFTISSCVLMAQSSVELKYNLEKGKVYKAKSSTVQDQTMTIQGQDRVTETKNSTCFSLRMLDGKSDFFLAEVKFDTIKTIVSAPPMVLSSAEKGDINSTDPIEVTKCVLNRLSNSTMVVKLDYTGHVQDIMNHGVIQQTVLAGTDSLKGQAAMAKGQYEVMVKKESLMGMIESVTAYMPNEKVKKGSKWESSFTSNSGGVGMFFTSSYVAKEVSKETVVVEADVVVEPSSSEPTVMNGAEITNELKGLGKTTMEIDPETGWIISSSSKMQLAGNMIVNAPGQNMTLPITSIITSEISVLE